MLGSKELETFQLSQFLPSGKVKFLIWHNKQYRVVGVIEIVETNYNDWKFKTTIGAKIDPPQDQYIGVKTKLLCEKKDIDDAFDNERWKDVTLTSINDWLTFDDKVGIWDKIDKTEVYIELYTAVNKFYKVAHNLNNEIRESAKSIDELMSEIGYGFGEFRCTPKANGAGI